MTELDLHYLPEAIEAQMLKICALLEKATIRHDGRIDAAWTSKTGKRCYVSVQMEAAMDYLRKHPDAKLSVVSCVCKVSDCTASKARKALRAEKEGNQ